MSAPVVFVGAGVASISAIESLRESGEHAPIVLLSAERHLPYDRPPLSKEVLLGRAPTGVLLRPEPFYDAMSVELRLDSPAVSLDLGDRSVTDARGRVIRAERLVLATGGVPRTLPIPGADLPGVCVLRTLDDALALEARLETGARIVVIGGGFIGTEVAAAASERGLDVTLLEALPAPLQSVLPELAPYVVDRHRARGVRIRTDVRIDSFIGADRVTGVRLADGEEITADVVVVGVGMRPHDQLAAQAGLAVGNGVYVDASGRTSRPGVYAIGDAANVEDGRGGRRRIEHWQNAVRAGQRLASTFAGLPPEPAAVPWFWSDQYDLNIQMAGHPAPDDQRVIRGDPATGRATVLFHRDARLTAAVALNNGRDIRPATDLIAGAARIDPGVLAEPGTDLRKLARELLRAHCEKAVEGVGSIR